MPDTDLTTFGAGSGPLEPGWRTTTKARGLNVGRFDGKSVIVTGGAMSIGRCIALAFAADGALVTVADTAVAPSAEVISEIRRSGLGQAQAIRTDVARSTDALAA